MPTTMGSTIAITSNTVSAVAAHCSMYGLVDRMPVTVQDELHLHEYVQLADSDVQQLPVGQVEVVAWDEQQLKSAEKQNRLRIEIDYNYEVAINKSGLVLAIVALLSQLAVLLSVSPFTMQDPFVVEFNTSLKVDCTDEEGIELFTSATVAYEVVE